MFSPSAALSTRTCTGHGLVSHKSLDKPDSANRASDPSLTMKTLSACRFAKINCSRPETAESVISSEKRKLCLLEFLCSAEFQPKPVQFLAVLVLACSLSSLRSSRRSAELLKYSPPLFCSISSSSDQPVIQAQIRIKVKKAQADMSKEELDEWLETFKEEAMQRGVSKDTIVEALDGVTPSERIIRNDQNQPEKKLTAESYLKTMVNEFRISKGVQMFLENKTLIEEVSAAFGVPASVLASIWGIESNYGSFQGSWNVIQALVTLAFNSPESYRRSFFREELFHALFILDSGDGPAVVSDMKGSWAGAMGQCQFMPSSYMKFAVDYDKDGRKDIWTSHADVFASMANYLVGHGWQTGGRFAQQVHVPDDIDKAVCGLDVQKTVGEWINEFNVRPCDEQLQGDELVSLVAPDGPSGVAYLVGDNFRVIMKYNISTLYSIAVYELAREINARAGAATSVTTVCSDNAGS